MVIATTNRINAIDPAIRRPGRFDYHIEVVLPDTKGRQAILQAHLNKMRTSSDLNLSAIAETTEGFSGAHMSELVSFAKRIKEEKECTMDVAFMESLEKLKNQKQLVQTILESNGW